MNRTLLVPLVPLVTVLGGFALRLYHLGADSLWYDETVSLLLARSELAELIRHTAGDIHPPFYYVLLHFWGRLAGWSEFSAAFLSLWFGVLLIALVYRAAREWTLPSRPSPFGARGKGEVMLAAFLVAISPYNIWYSQEVRMYTLGASLGLLSVLFLRRMLRAQPPSPSDFFGYMIVTALGLYTLYYFAFLMLFEWLWAIYRLWPRSDQEQSTTHNQQPTPKLVFAFLLAQLLVLVLYLPWLPIAIRQAADPPVPPWREFTALPQMLIESFSALTFGQSVDPIVVVPLLMLLALSIGATFVIRSTRHFWHLAVSPWFLLGYTLIPLLAIYLLSLWKPLYHVRYVFIYSPAFYILTAYGLYTVVGHVRRRTVGTARRVVRGALAALMTGLFLFTTAYSLYNFWHNPRYAPDDLRGAVTYLAEHWRPGDAIVVNAGYAYPAVLYYWERGSAEPLAGRLRLTDFQNPSSPLPVLLLIGSIGGSSGLGWGDPRSDFYATTAEEARAALARVVAAYPRLWMLRIYDTVVDPDGVIRHYLNEHAQLLDDQVFTGESNARVQGYLTQSLYALPPSAAPRNAHFGDRVELVGVETGPRELPRGAFFDVVLYWRLLPAGVNVNYQLSLQLLDVDGQNVAQFDETPLSALLPMTRWRRDTLYREPVRLKIPPALAPGEYRAIVKLYNPRTLEVLGEPIELGKVAVH